jgi:hypothetical protein
MASEKNFEKFSWVPQRTVANFPLSQSLECEIPKAIESDRRWLPQAFDSKPKTSR